MMDEKWTPLEKKLLGGVLLLGIAVVILLIAFFGGSDGKKEPSLPAYQVPEAESKKKVKLEEEPNELVVDVKGEVKKPGIYRLPSKARTMDAITEAGGPSKEADLDRVNLAAPLADGTAIYIPKKGEEIIPVAGVEAGGEPGSQGGRININTAGLDELQQLNGIGPSKAEAILRYREENGRFSSVEELTNVPGIGEKTLENFKDQATVR